jgi:hypothetical protein
MSTFCLRKSEHKSTARYCHGRKFSNPSGMVRHFGSTIDWYSPLEIYASARKVLLGSSEYRFDSGYFQLGSLRSMDGITSRRVKISPPSKE